MPSLTSQFGDTREISSEQYQNTAKITKNQEFRVETEEKLAFSSAQVIPLGTLGR